MNSYLLAILIFLVGTYALRMTARALNRAALSPELPPEFADTLDQTDYARSQEYARATMRFEDWSESISLLLTLAFILIGGFNSLDVLVRSANFAPIPTGLLYCGTLALLSTLADLPLSIYRTFVLEQRFGFNTTTAATFIADFAKTLLLTTILGGIVLSAILWFFAATGAYASLWCWAFTTLFSLLLTYIAPQWILPLFNRFSPLPQGELRNAIEAYTAAQHYTVTGIFTIDGSRRSTKANAFFTGFGKKKRIALFDTLITRHAKEEIVAVLAHEIGHGQLGHIRKGLISSILQTGALFFLMGFFLNNRALFDAFGVTTMSTHVGLILFALLYSPVSLCLSLVSNAMSRKHEFEADAFAAQTTQKPQDLIRALKRLCADSLSNLTPHKLTIWLDHGHPPVLQRIRALQQYEKTMS